MLRRFFVALFIFALFLWGVPLWASDPVCPVTAKTPGASFIPPAPYLEIPPGNEGFWYGTASLWTIVRSGVMFVADPGVLSAKLVYWRAGFDGKTEPHPELAVVARRIDGPGPVVLPPPANAVRLPDDESPASNAMMTGITIPVPGCWEIRASYKGQTLIYFVSVAK